MNKTVLSGIGVTMFSYFLFSLQDASVKLLVVGLPVIQILFIRSVVIGAMCLAIGGRQVARDAVRSPVLLPMVSRNILLLAAWLTFYTAAKDLGLAELTTVYYASPIIITILAAPILKEHIPPLRWCAVILGFIGVVIASDPFSSAMTLSLPVGLGLIAACFWAVSTVLLRKTAMQERTLVQMAISSGFFIIMTGIACIFFWTPLSWFQLTLLVGTGLFAGVAQFAFFEGIRRAPASVLAPIEYTSLVWAFVLGYVIWHEIPGKNVFFGAGLIFSSGMLILIGERFTKSQKTV
jgi:drug/metabolite transporter (DMT)-like permease